MGMRVRIEPSGSCEYHPGPRSRAAAVVVARLERVRDLEAVALSVALGGVLWLILASLANLME